MNIGWFMVGAAAGIFLAWVGIMAAVAVYGRNYIRAYLRQQHDDNCGDQGGMPEPPMR